MPFVGFQRWANPAFYDELMQVCARGGLSAPRIVQEATDRDTQLGLVLCRIGIAWQTESILERRSLQIAVSDMAEKPKADRYSNEPADK